MQGAAAIATATGYWFRVVLPCAPATADEKALAAAAANRDNLKIKNRRKLLQLKLILKVNRDKSAVLVSPHFRLA